MSYDYRYYGVSDGQYLFDFNLKGLFFFGLLGLKALFHLPHLFTAYIFSTQLLDPKESGLVWITTTLLLGYFISLLFALFKAFIIALKRRRNLLWLPLLLLAVTYSCILPTWMIWEGAGPLLKEYFLPSGELWILMPLFFFCLYLQKHFFKYVLFR